MIEIAGRRIGKGYPPYIIAEMSANHNGSMDKAVEIIKLAKSCGADAVKLQSYTPDTITLDVNHGEFLIEDGPWKGQSLYELYKSAFMPWEWHKKLFEVANEIGITVFSSPFDTSAVDLLEELDAPAYKIASFEAIDIPLIRRVSATGKPVIISTGMANVEEIGEAVEAARSAGCDELSLLLCVSGYPASPKEYNLATLKDLEERFGVVVGLSDHSMGVTTSVASVALGASIIEKHFIVSRSEGGVDSHFSIEPDELKTLCESSRAAWEAIGEVSYDKQPSELGNIKFRRSLYVVENIQEGQLLDERNVRSIRPGYGLKPKHIDQVIGKRANRILSKGTALSWDMFS